MSQSKILAQAILNVGRQWLKGACISVLIILVMFAIFKLVGSYEYGIHILSGFCVFCVLAVQIIFKAAELQKLEEYRNFKAKLDSENEMVGIDYKEIRTKFESACKESGDIK